MNDDIELLGLQPTIFRDVQSTIFRDVQPTISRDVQPTIFRDEQSTIFRDVQPTILRDVQPTIFRDVQSTIFRDVVAYNIQGCAAYNIQGCVERLIIGQTSNNNLMWQKFKINNDDDNFCIIYTLKFWITIATASEVKSITYWLWWCTDPGKWILRCEAISPRVVGCQWHGMWSLWQHLQLPPVPLQALVHWAALQTRNKGIHLK